jgi:hypothetical protein
VSQGGIYEGIVTSVSSTLSTQHKPEPEPRTPTKAVNSKPSQNATDVGNSPGEVMRISDAHQLKPLGYEKYGDISLHGVTPCANKHSRYRDSEMFSDVNILYGQNGERTFRGHKVVLSSQSHWFQAAFIGNIQVCTLTLKPDHSNVDQESELKDVLLKGDDPDAVHYMLCFAYDQPSVWIWRHLSKDPHFWLNAYEVADKYSFPALEKHAIDMLSWHWESFLGGIVNVTPIQCEGYRDVVNRIYAIANANREHPMVQMLLTHLFKGDDLNLISNHGEILSVISKTAEDNAEYGRDVLVHLMGSIGWGNATQGIEIALTKKVKYKNCEKTWMRSYDLRNEECE